MSVSLAELIGGNRANWAVDITGLTADSRNVRAGDLFVALPGSNIDGRDFIADAVKAGAAAILTTPGLALDLGVPVVEDRNPRKRYAEFSARFYDGQPSTAVAITGTNGKTSVADFTRQIWQALGKNAASIGTLGVRSRDVNHEGGLTTPDPMQLHKVLRELSDAGVDHAALEASSHGLDQRRLDGVQLQAAAFTNLSRDHMDYHKNEQGYFYAKARLFGELIGPGDTAVINTDNRRGSDLDDIVWARGITRLSVGCGEEASIRLIRQEVIAAGQTLCVRYEGARYDIELPLIGGFQAENALLAAGLVIATNGTPSEVFCALASLKGVPGRMEFMGETSTGGGVYVDYAHTPDGLATVLKAARSHNPKQLHVVFGCGGDRDVGKRPQMGAIATRLADCVYVTDDNPRSESAGEIRSEIMKAAPGAVELSGRKNAIETAISFMKCGDILVVAGKGHEEGQIVGDEIIPFSDIRTVAELIGSGTTKEFG
ncbi:MAG: UDP-N-acetylmuramoyl-L-alanyl-D-glutamate--2,6-diaminopimelate ligase [Kordiimonadales bacterium]|nr:MAG: UDP-N-acetylmuramoyl-L-alanyl-D-glutamate--2,6-diaminopimelate ligase [Kordiimonadales bacterium]